MKRNTKHKIIEAAVEFFNKEGFAAISMQELANGLGMSRGNLTYHFKDKDTLLRKIAEQMWIEMGQERIHSRTFPSFQNLHNEVQLYYKIQRSYAFIFLDPHVLKHKYIREQFRKMTEETIRDNKTRIAFSVQMGNMYPEKIPGTYHNLAFISWMLTFFWLAQQIIRGEKTEEDGEKMIWSIMIPHFTEKGLNAFKNFFGEEYYNDLGQPFDVDISQFIGF